MKKLLLITLIITFACLMAGLALAKGGPKDKNRDVDVPGKSPAAHEYLYQMDTADWTILEDGAWGKINYKLSGTALRVNFNGHQLEPALDYTLVYDLGEDGLVCLATGTVNPGGNLHLGSVSIIDQVTEQAQMMLVLADDVICTSIETGLASMIAWNPSDYLLPGDFAPTDDDDDPTDDDDDPTNDDDEDPVEE